MSRPTRSELLDDILACLTDAISCQSWDRIDTLRSQVRQLWLDEIAIETRAACADKEVA